MNQPCLRDSTFIKCKSSHVRKLSFVCHSEERPTQKSELVTPLLTFKWSLNSQRKWCSSVVRLRNSSVFVTLMDAAGIVYVWKARRTLSRAKVKGITSSFQHSMLPIFKSFVFPTLKDVIRTRPVKCAIQRLLLALSPVFTSIIPTLFVLFQSSGSSSSASWILYSSYVTGSSFYQHL